MLETGREQHGQHAASFITVFWVTASNLILAHTLVTCVNCNRHPFCVIHTPCINRLYISVIILIIIIIIIIIILYGELKQIKSWMN